MPTLLLIPTTSYKTADFMAAADELGVEVVIGTDVRQALETEMPGFTLAVDLADPLVGGHQDGVGDPERGERQQDEHHHVE